MKFRRFCTVFLLLALLLTQILPVTAYAVEDIEIQARSALLVDGATGTVLLDQNAHTKQYPASITKVMTALLVFEAIDRGELRLDQTLTASANSVAGLPEDASTADILPGENLTVEQLLYCLLVVSANEVGNILGEAVSGSVTAFVADMNRRAQELGMTDTNFVNCTGLDDGEDAKNHRTSAHDIALMSRELLKNHPDVRQFTTIWMDTVRQGAFGLSNTNKMIRFYPGATGLKTGFTSGAGYCLSASAQRDGMELVAVVMGADSSKTRFNACKQLLDYGFANFALVQPDICDTPAVPVELGTAKTVSPQLGEDGTLLVEKGLRSTVTAQVELEETVEAPVHQGQRLGTLTYRSGEQILRQIPLVAEQEVPRLSWKQMFGKVFRRMAMAAE